MIFSSLQLCDLPSDDIGNQGKNHLILGLLIHEFDWKLKNWVSEEKLDMEEEFGITLVTEESIVPSCHLCTCMISKNVLQFSTLLRFQ